MKKILIALTLALSLMAASAGNMIYVANVESSDPVETPLGTWYFFTMFPPTSPGVYYWQYSTDAGLSWYVLNTVDFSDLSNPTQVSVWVNPLIRPPYIWYRFFPVSASFRQTHNSALLPRK